MLEQINYVIMPSWFVISYILLLMYAASVQRYDRQSRYWWKNTVHSTNGIKTTFPSYVYRDNARVLLVIIPIWIWTAIGIFTTYMVVHWIHIIIAYAMAFSYDKNLGNKPVYVSRAYYLVTIGMFLAIIADQNHIITMPYWLKF